jgi:cytochrome c oxidase cbb3-type subunit I/II
MNHRELEGRALLFSVLVVVAMLVGTLIELVPMYAVKANVPTIDAVQPYTALEVMGRHIYIREGCNNCHSQMIRPFRAETERYGEYSKAGEFVYEHPFLWGSKRTGPDLHRVGGKYNDMWHFKHMLDPRTTSEGSLMPPYPWLGARSIDFEDTSRHLKALKGAGVPYSDADVTGAPAAAAEQAGAIVARLAEGGEQVAPETEIVALIAYLQRLGTDLGRAKEQP